ncbi:MAG TPA: hypothetical protein VMA53_26225 [Stellaceae bacterium]|jgi:hypothetical protein|nr:hypothetical protein [Stellaceae bacterium]
MKMLLAATLLVGFASFTSAHAEWEILDSGSAVYAGAATTPVTATAKSAAPATTASGATKEFAKNDAASK